MPGREASIPNASVPLPGALKLCNSGLLALIGLKGRFFN